MKRCHFTHSTLGDILSSGWRIAPFFRPLFVAGCAALALQVAEASGPSCTARVGAPRVLKPDWDTTPANLLTSCSRSSFLNPTVICEMNGPTNKITKWLHTNEWTQAWEAWTLSDSGYVYSHGGSPTNTWLNLTPTGEGIISCSDDPEPCTATVVVTILTGATSTDYTNVFFVGSSPGACGSSGCGVNQTADLGTGSIANEAGPRIAIALGPAASTYSAPFLSLNPVAKGLSLGDRDALYVPFVPLGVEVISSGSTLQQVRSPQGLVHVAPISSTKYVLQVFDSQKIATKTNVLYGTNGAAFVAWTVDAPAGTPGQLTITEARDGVNREFTFTSNNVSGIAQWDLTDGAGLRTVRSWKEQVTGDSLKYTKVTEVRSGANVLERTAKTYVLLGNDQTGRRPMLSAELHGTGTTTNGTAYYYTTSGLLQARYSSDGPWEYISYDDSSRISTRYEAYGDTAPPDPATGPTPSTAPCRITRYYYTNSPSGYTNMVRQETVELPQSAGGGSYEYKVVSKVVRDAETNNRIVEWRWEDPTKTEAADAEVTRHQFYLDIAGPALAGRTQWRIGPDGVAELHEYTTNTVGGLMAEAILRGTPNNTTNPTAIGEGTRVDTFYNGLGRVTGTLTRQITGTNAAAVLANVTNYYSGVLSNNYNAVDLGNRSNSVQ